MVMIEVMIMFLGLLCGLLAGVYSGLIGVGGGTIIIPFLVAFLGFSQHAAQGTSLAVMLPPITALAVWTYYKEGFVHLPTAGYIMIGFIFGALLGAKFAVMIPALWMKKIFGIFLVVLGIKYLFY